MKCRCACNGKNYNYKIEYRFKQFRSLKYTNYVKKVNRKHGGNLKYYIKDISYNIFLVIKNIIYLIFVFFESEKFRKYVKDELYIIEGYNHHLSKLTFDNSYYDLNERRKLKLENLNDV